MQTNNAFQQPENQSNLHKRIGGAPKQKTSADIIICYGTTLLTCSTLAIGLYCLSVNTFAASLIASCCMLLFPLGYALTRGKRILFALTCIIFGLAAIIGLFTQSMNMFIVFYASFLLLGLLVALSVRINGR